MKHIIQILSVILVLPLFGFGQKADYKIIQKGATEYEFNKARDIIYILTKDGAISVYDIAKQETKEIKLSKYKRIGYRDHSVYLSETDTLFVFGEYNIYKIFEDSLIEDIPFLLNGKLDVSYYDEDPTYNGKTKILSDFLSNAVEISNINSCKIIRKANGEKLAVRDLNISILKSDIYYDKSNIVENNIIVVFAEGEHRRQRKNGKNIGGEKKQIKYFGGAKIIDKIYNCKNGDEHYTLAICKYKMKIITEDKTYILDNTLRQRRYVGIGFGKHTWTCDLFYRAPTSSYITDKDGNIFILFDSNEYRNSLNLIQLL